MSDQIQESEVVSETGHLLASTHRPSEIFLDIIDRVQNQPSSILDLGAGNARLAPTITEHFPNASIVAVDIDRFALPKFDDTPINVRRLTADAFRLPLKPKTFEMALAINAAHEVCGSLDEMERFKNFINLVRGVETVVKPGGEFIFIDGIMPDDSDKSVSLRPKTQEAQSDFVFFIDSYVGKDLTVDKKSNRTYNLRLGDLVVFLTKILYLKSESWEDERHQLYPFLTLDQIKGVLRESGFKIEEVLHPIVRRNLDLLMSNYEIEGINFEDFPPVQAAIRAIRFD